MNVEIGRKIASKRIEKGFTQDNFATLLHICQSDVSKIENGTKELNDELRKQIAKILEMDIMDLVDKGNVSVIESTFKSNANIAHSISINLNVTINLNGENKEELAENLSAIFNEVKKLDKGNKAT